MEVTVDCAIRAVKFDPELRCFEPAILFPLMFVQSEIANSRFSVVKIVFCQFYGASASILQTSSRIPFYTPVSESYTISSDSFQLKINCPLFTSQIFSKW